MTIILRKSLKLPTVYWQLFQHDGDAAAYARIYIQFVRAFAESTMMKRLFRDAPALCDEFFHRCETAIASESLTREIQILDTPAGPGAALRNADNIFARISRSSGLPAE